MMTGPKTFNTDRPELSESQFLALLNHVIHNVDLPSFLETEAGCNIRYASEESGVCCCPLHGENKRSFHINLMDGVWIAHCFGCGFKGHIIHFFMDYYDIPNKFEAVMVICEKFGFEATEDMFLDGLKNLEKKVDTQKELECANIVTSNQCRMLLRKDYKKYGKWVVSTYKKLNTALEDGNLDEVLQLGHDASNRATEG